MSWSRLSSVLTTNARQVMAPKLFLFFHKGDGNKQRVEERRRAARVEQREAEQTEERTSGREEEADRGEKRGGVGGESGAEWRRDSDGKLATDDCKCFHVHAALPPPSRGAPSPCRALPLPSSMSFPSFLLPDLPLFPLSCVT